MHTKVPAVETNMAAAPRAAQWFTAANGTRHPLIEISSDNSDDEVAAVGGSCDALAPLDPAAAQASDASKDDERVEDLTVAGVCSRTNMFCLFRSSTCVVDYFREMAQMRAHTELTESCKRGGASWAFWRAGAANTSPEHLIT